MSGPDGEEQLQQRIQDLFETDEEDDDIFEPATDASVETDDLEDATGTDEYTDANEELDDIEIVFEGGEDDEEDGTATETDQPTAAPTQAQPAQAAQARNTAATLATLQRLLGGRAGLQRFLQEHNYTIVYSDENGNQRQLEDDEDEDYWPYRRRRRPRHRSPPDPNRFPPVPNPEGRKLMESGVFGSHDTYPAQRYSRRRNISERLLWRRMGLDPRPTSRRYNKLIAQDMIPNSTHADKIIHYDSRAYSGQYSDDGNFFFSCTQNFRVQMYDTSNPYDWKYYKTVDFPFGQWTITDATLSPDNRFLAYSSIRHTVCLAPTDPNDPNDHTMLDFQAYAPGASVHDRHGYMGRTGFGIWSLRFSGDGREIVAGTSDHNVLVYDLETRKTTLKLRKHHDDVNAVCFGDKSSPHILFSGSDDQTLRVWDRRSMADGREAGVFVGHTEGITYVDSKGDGRYVLSNGKDQMMKLWDLRKMVPPSKFDRMNLQNYTSDFDYRFAPYNDDDYRPNPDDCSVVTFRGHKVLKTLIRCHFSPPTSTNSRYVYSGSEDGKVHIWNLDATPKATIDVATATRDTRPRAHLGGGEIDWDMGYNNNIWKTCVRDASWSPTVPQIAATSWNGWGMSTGTVSVHSWNDTPSNDLLDDADGAHIMGQSYTAKLQVSPSHHPRSSTRRTRDNGGRGLRSNPVRVNNDNDNTDTNW